MGCIFKKNYSSDSLFEQSSQTFEIAERLQSFQFKSVQDSFPLSPKKILTYQEVLKVMSFNILADAYTDSNFHYCQSDFMKFSYRGPQILRIIETLNPNIICLQEVDHYKEFYYPNLSKKYHIFEEKRGEDYEGKDGLLIAFEKKTFKFLKKAVVSYDLGVNEVFFESFKNPNRFKKGNKALVIELESFKTNEKYIIVNTHLHWDPSEEDVKQFQFLELLNYLEDRYNKNEQLILCGDFNSLPESEQIQLCLKENFKGFEGRTIQTLFEQMKRKKRKIKFRSAYSKYRQKNQRNMHPSFTNFTANFKGTLDYIFFNKRSKLQLRRILKIPKSSELSLNVALPNKNWPSDHLPLMAEFILEESHTIQVEDD